MFDYDGFRNGLRAYRLKAGLTQEKVSEIVDISEHHLSALERGKARPSFGTIINLCNALEISVNDCVVGGREQSLLFLNQLNDYLKEFSHDDKEFLYQVLICLEEYIC